MSALAPGRASTSPRDARRPPARGARLLPRGRADRPAARARRSPSCPRARALELTREEVPHAITAEVDEIEDGRARVLLYVETESQKGIVVGKGGSMIREIGPGPGPRSSVCSVKVFLELVVKVKPRWRRDEALLERLGI